MRNLVTFARFFCGSQLVMLPLLLAVSNNWPIHIAIAVAVAAFWVSVEVVAMCRATSEK